MAIHRTIPHVALMTWSFPPCHSGLGRAAGEIAYALVSAGLRVTVIAADKSGLESHEGGMLRVLGIDASKSGAIARRRKLAGIGHMVMPQQFRSALLSVHRDDPVHLVEATNWYAPAALIAGQSLPLVVRNSTPAWDAYDPAASVRDRLDLRVASWLEGRTARRATALISNTAPHRGEIERLYRLPKHIPHSIVGLSLSDDMLARGKAAGRPNPLKGPHILFIGRAERRKGFTEAVHGFRKFAQTLPERRKGSPRLTLVGIGEADLEAALPTPEDRRVRHMISLRPQVSDDELMACYEDCHIVLAPSRYESYGLVYREAAAFGRPVVASADDPSARALFAINGCGVLAPTTSQNALAEALCQLWQQPARRTFMARIGRQYARSLTRKQLSAQTLRVYERVLGGQSEGELSDGFEYSHAA